MSGKVFVDTNILLYARDSGERKKQSIAQAWLSALWQQRRGRLSFQVLQEYYINVTQKLVPGLSVVRARQDVRNLALWNPIKADLTLIEAAWTLVDRYRFAWWDAQIVAAARRADCVLLLSEDMQHGLDVDGTRVVNPFAEGAPAPVGI